MPPDFVEPLSLPTPDRSLVRNTPSQIPKVPNRKPHEKIWRSIFETLTEAEFSSHNHLNFSNLSTTCLNKFFFQVPPPPSS